MICCWNSEIFSRRSMMFILWVFFLLGLVLPVFIFYLFVTQSASLKVAPSLPQPLFFVAPWFPAALPPRLFPACKLKLITAQLLNQDKTSSGEGERREVLSLCTVGSVQSLAPSPHNGKNHIYWAMEDTAWAFTRGLYFPVISRDRAHWPMSDLSFLFLSTWLMCMVVGYV